MDGHLKVQHNANFTLMLQYAFFLSLALVFVVITHTRQLPLDSGMKNKYVTEIGILWKVNTPFM